MTVMESFHVVKHIGLYFFNSKIKGLKGKNLIWGAPKFLQPHFVIYTLMYFSKYKIIYQ